MPLPRQFPTTAIVLSALIAIVAVALLDHLTGPELAFSVFYAIPVAMAAWSAGTRIGLAVSVFAGLGWLGVELQDNVYSHPAIYGWNALVREVFFAVIAILLGRLRQLLKLQRELALTDPLTGLANLRAFHRHLADEIARAHRVGRPFALAYIDLDNFKRLNDRAGHAKGDEILKLVADVLRVRTRQTDVCARLGGDEFAVLLIETGEQNSRTFFEDLQTKLKKALLRSGTGVDASIGAITWLTPPRDAAHALDDCDRLMYSVKRSGKGALQLRAHNAPPADESFRSMEAGHDIEQELASLPRLARVPRE